MYNTGIRQNDSFSKQLKTTGSLHCTCWILSPVVWQTTIAVIRQRWYARSRHWSSCEAVAADVVRDNDAAASQRCSSSRDLSSCNHWWQTTAVTSCNDRCLHFHSTADAATAGDSRRRGYTEIASSSSGDLICAFSALTLHCTPYSYTNPAGLGVAFGRLLHAKCHLHGEDGVLEDCDCRRPRCQLEDNNPRPLPQKGLALASTTLVLASSSIGLDVARQLLIFLIINWIDKEKVASVWLE